MKKFLKIFGITVVSLLVLMIVIPLCFTGQIVKKATSFAGEYVDAKVNIADADLSLFRSFPGLNIRLEGVSLTGVKEFEGDTLVNFDRLELSVDLWHFIAHQKLKIRSVILDNTNLNIKVLENGKANYDISKSDTAQTQEEVTDTTSSEFSVALKKFEINNLNLKYDDRQSDMYAAIDSLNYNLSGDLSQNTSLLDMVLNIARINFKQDGIQLVKNAKLKFKSEIEADLTAKKFTFNENQLDINQLGLGFDGWVAMPDTSIDMDMKFAARQTDFKSVLSLIPADYSSDLKGVETAGTFSFSGYAKGTYNAVQIPAFGVNLVVDKARFKYPDLPASVEDININADVESPGDINIIKLAVNKLHLVMAGNPVDAVLGVETSAKDVALKGDINAKVDLATIGTVVPLDDMTMKGLINAAVAFAGNLSSLESERYDQFDAKGTISVTDFSMPLEGMPVVDIHTAQLTLSPQKASLDNLNMNLGKSDFKLNGKVDNIFQYLFADSTLKASFVFNSTLIDVNDIYSYDKSSAVSQTSTSVEDTSATTAPEIPLNIDFVLDSKINKILYDSLQISDLNGKIGLKNGVASFNNLNLKMLDGTCFASGFYDASDYTNPAVDLSLDLSNIGIQKSVKTFNTVKEMAPIAQNCFGNLTAKLNFKSKLDNSLSPILNTVNGDGRLITKEISIKESKIFGLVGAATKNSKLTNPKLKDINIGFKIVDGNVTIDSTAFKLADNDADISGTLNLDKNILFNLGLNLSETVANSLLSKVSDGKQGQNVKVYATIGGTVDNPKIVGFKTSATDILKDVVNEKVEEVKQKLSEAAQKYIAQAKAKADAIIAAAKQSRDKMIAEAKVAAEKAKTEAKAVSDKIIADAKSQADKLVAKASNPIAKAAEQKFADNLIAKAKKDADAKLAQASKQADSLVSTAETNGNKIVDAAKDQADKINSEAVAKAQSM